MNADLALSVTMTTVSTFLSLGFLPMNLYIYSIAAYRGQETSSGEDILASIDYSGIYLSLGIVMSAIGTGIFCSWKIDTPHWHKISYLGGNISGIALIVWSTSLSFYPYDDSKPTADEVLEEGQEEEYYVAIVLPCILGLIAAGFLSSAVGLPKPERLTTAVECCYQNTGIATSAAFSLFGSDPEQLSMAMLVPTIYGFVDAFAIGLYLIVFWKMGWSKAPSNEKFFVVVARSYEIAYDGIEKDEDNQPKEENQASDIIDIGKDEEQSETEIAEQGMVS